MLKRLVPVSGDLNTRGDDKAKAYMRQLAKARFWRNAEKGLTTQSLRLLQIKRSKLSRLLRDMFYQCTHGGKLFFTNSAESVNKKLKLSMNYKKQSMIDFLTATIDSGL